MTEITRRSALIGAAVGAGLGFVAGPMTLGATKAEAVEAARTTIILSPHPDDEVIRLAHYAARVADRGDRLILVQATNGAATHVGRDLGLTPEETTAWRYREQNHAWDWLTYGQGEIVRLGLPDAGLRPEPVVEALTDLVTEPTTEIYVSSWHYERPEAIRGDQHPDHMACVDAARVMQERGVIVRYAVHPTSPTVRSAKYRAEGHQLLRVQGAVDSYQVIGRRSTRNLDLVLDSRTRVTR